MDSDLRDSILVIVKLLRNRREWMLELDAKLNALQLIVGRSIGLSPDEMSKAMSELRSQFRDLEPDRAEREQMDAMLQLLESRKDPSQSDS